MAKKIQIDLSKVKEKTQKALRQATPIAQKIGENATQAIQEGKTYTQKVLIPKANEISHKTEKVANETKEKIFNAVDTNGDGEIGIDDIIIIALQIPGIKINRKDFLTKEFYKNHSDEQIQKIINSTPTNAGISSEELDHIADEVIQFERTCVSGISAALSAQGGIAMVATLPADISQYYGYMLRCAQKLMYLYGFPQIEIQNNKNNIIDSEIMNTLIICLGVMYGVAGANTALQAMAKALSIGVEKQLIKKALTKGTLYPIVKSVAKWFNIKMTKQIFAGFFKKSIPVIGGVIGGGLTYLSFKPCCDNLKETLRNTSLSNKNYADSQDVIDLLDM